ncbi:MAG TPA: Lrp/AsnC ligand binding domain-containing protein [Thermoplasmata archaeon]|nr:Lrp/AsnC ligand binding domain-containing protein [Thermoplasmata archaeon]
MADDPRQLTLYVQSKKAVTSFYRAPVGPGGSNYAGIGIGSVPAAPTSPDEAPGVSDSSVHFLSDDQARCVAVTEEIAAQRGYRVNVVDIEKVGRIERLIAEHLKGVQRFPVLITPRGARLEGVPEFTPVKLAELMPAELKAVRAFTYLKVRGGDLDRIRQILETLTPVKELHFLTGDWDILVVLEFPTAGSNKRTVLDFVTERIRGIPEVLDTSTVVPEYTLTKFPLF